MQLRRAELFLFSDLPDRHSRKDSDVIFKRTCGIPVVSLEYTIKECCDGLHSLLEMYTISLILPFLGAFAKLRKATISFVLSVRLSVRMEQLGSHWTEFDKL